MKIAIINPSDEFEIGVKGGNQYIAEALAKYIRKYTNHEVITIFTPSKVFPGISLIKSYIMHRLIDLSRFDLVITLKFPSFFISHKNHVCYFAHFYRDFYDLWKENPNNKKITFRIMRYIIKKTDYVGLKNTKKIYAYSKFIQEHLKEEQIESELLYCPPIEENFKSKRYDYILSSSILDDNRKRISLLIKAMNYVKSNTKLLIVGDGPHKEELMKLAKEDKRIIFLGYKSPKDMIKIYSNSLCTCLVSYKEDYGLVTIESMKSKKPVITCIDSGGPLEFVEHEKSGLISEPNPLKISENMNRLIKDKDFAKKLGENGYERVKNISWKNLINKLIDDKIL